MASFIENEKWCFKKKKNNKGNVQMYNFFENYCICFANLSRYLIPYICD